MRFSALYGTYLCLRKDFDIRQSSRPYEFSLEVIIMTVQLYSSWFCPYAQRVWCALNEYGVSYDLIESFRLDPETHHYIKIPELLKYNPKGLVPTLVELKSDEEQLVKCESLDILKDLCSTYVNEEEAERQILDCEIFNRSICSPFYRVLMKHDPDERLQAWNEMLRGLESYSTELFWENKGSNSISFFKGATDRPTIVDLAVFPWVHRLFILDHFKSLSVHGKEGAMMSKEGREKIMKWKSKMESHPSVKTTLAQPDKLIPVYIRYANGTANSKVGDAVRSGKEAHDAK